MLAQWYFSPPLARWHYLDRLLLAFACVEWGWAQAFSEVWNQAPRAAVPISWQPDNKQGEMQTCRGRSSSSRLLQIPCSSSGMLEILLCCFSHKIIMLSRNSVSGNLTFSSSLTTTRPCFLYRVGTAAARLPACPPARDMKTGQHPGSGLSCSGVSVFLLGLQLLLRTALTCVPVLGFRILSLPGSRELL